MSKRDGREGPINVYQGLLSFLPPYVERDTSGLLKCWWEHGVDASIPLFSFHFFLRRLYDNEHLLFRLDSFLLALGDESAEHAWK
jgi:hypothetical protein